MFEICLCMVSVMDYGSASRKHLESNTIASNNKHAPLKSSLVFPGHGSGSRPAKNSDTSDTIYSSSSDSSSDDFVQVNTKTLPKFKAPNNIPKPNGGPKSLYKNEKFDVSIETFYRLEESINESPQSTSQFSDITYDSLVTHPSPILSPHVQVMERAEPTVFDPNRIPTSIFSRPSTPTEWSVASNESLFSIHIGNNSFSRDHIARINNKSGELLKSGELCRSPEIYQSGELCMADDVATPCETMGIRQTSPIAKGVESNKILDMERNPCEDMNPRETGIVVRVDDVAKVPMNNRVDANLGEFRDSPSANRHSDKSETYIQSVAVPRRRNLHTVVARLYFAVTGHASPVSGLAAVLNGHLALANGFGGQVAPPIAVSGLPARAVSGLPARAPVRAVSGPPVRAVSGPPAPVVSGLPALPVSATA
ncbi:hypothetical protein BUALT_Bualt17G0080700 [Buddleja alternifolia]|uniref:Uncharacterized protein n=1 Tax=Buddleja alternifolia TaxID=168488 RepID=A0AAV6WDK1_9LAMI|nr:hypothetical protein BUALT_Bualt17G0080700 [Buddleja alternifolia]